jgi:hypothetical protein
MTAKSIIVEERLRSTAPAVAIGVVALGYVALIAAFSTLGLSGRTAWLAGALYAVGLLNIVLLFVLARQIVARVVEGPDGRSFEVLYGRGGLVRQVFAPHEIVGATTRTLRLLQMGGWGCRGNLVLFHRAAVVTRRGDALELRLMRNRRFIVTVDEPDAFVSALTAGVN